MLDGSFKRAYIWWISIRVAGLKTNERRCEFMVNDYKTDSIWLMLGNCLDRMKEIEDNSIDLVLADPPYGTTSCKWDSIIPLEPMWEQLKRVIKTNGAIAMTASQPFTTVLIDSNMKMFRYCWVWHKSQSTGHLNSWRMPMKAHEDIVIFYNKLPTYNPKLIDKPVVNIRPVTSRTKKTDCYGEHNLDIHKCPPDKQCQIVLLNSTMLKEQFTLPKNQ